MWRHLAPAGAPIAGSDLARWAAAGTARADVFDALAGVIRARFAVRHVFLTSTGRAGLTILLRALRQLAPERDEVVVPAYTCYSVAASAIKAGLRVRIVDVAPSTFDYEPADLARADLRRVLAIVATNLYGLPSDMPALSALASRHGCFLVDDAAQAMGASIGGRPSGTWGDAGLYSFDKGKNVSAMSGGVIVTSSEAVAGAIRREMARLDAPTAVESAANIGKALAYFALLRPSLYWIPNAIPQLELGRTVFDTTFALARPDRALTALALSMMSRLDDFTRARVANAGAILGALRDVPAVRFPAAADSAQAVYGRAPLLVNEESARPRVLASLVAAGIGATASYPDSIRDVPEARPHLVNPDNGCPGGRYIARHLVTLPTHPFVTRADVDRMRTTILAAVQEEPPGSVQC